MNEEAIARWLEAGIQLLVFLGTIIFAAWKVIRKPLEEQLNGLGNRVTVVELDYRSHDTKIEGLDRRFDRQEFKMDAQTERLSSLDDKFSRLLTVMETSKEAGNKTEMGISERLTRIESKCDIGTQIRDAILIAVERFSHHDPR